MWVLPGSVRGPKQTPVSLLSSKATALKVDEICLSLDTKRIDK